MEIDRVSLGYPRVILDIIEEHFEELDFLWEYREQILFSRDYDLSELAEHEARCEAHLDGLRLAELHGIELARSAISADATFAATAAAFVFMASSDFAHHEELIEAFSRPGEEALRDRLRIGLRHCPLGELRDVLENLAKSADSGVAVCAADVLAFQRLARPEVAEARNADDPLVRRVAYEVLARTRSFSSLYDLAEALEDEDAAVRKMALEAAAQSGTEDLDELCRQVAREPDYPAELTRFLGVVGTAHDAGLLESLAAEVDRAVPALDALGALGRISSIPLLLDIMEDETRSRAAGDAFMRITGAEGILAEAPSSNKHDEEHEAGASEVDPGHPIEQAAFDAEFEDDTLPPDPEKARAWWHAHQGRFEPEGQWQSGVRVDGAVTTPLFNRLRLETRRDLQLAARARGVKDVPDLELASRATRQGA